MLDSGDAEVRRSGAGEDRGFQDVRQRDGSIREDICGEGYCEPDALIYCLCDRKLEEGF